MIIMGIDPGTAIIGWGIVETTGIKVGTPAYGSIQPESTEMSKRLLYLHRDLSQLIAQYHPDCMSVEELYFSTNAKTAISVGQARGVILLAAAQSSIPVVSYSPNTIKLAISGDGAADKKQVEKMVTLLLKLKSIPKPDDVADALAIALTHAYMHKIKAATS
jgi:crossover junction endodeoxyribonuclease RuvC